MRFASKVVTLLPLVLIEMTLFTNSCGMFSKVLQDNQPRASKTGENVPSTLASAGLSKLDIDTMPAFVGLAISGGGSRAANFGAAVMERLDQEGFLKHVNVISAVSGGALPASYYVLNRNSKDWSWATLRELIATDFASKMRWVHLSELPGYFLLGKNRSHMMASIFDDVLFNQATFGRLGDGMPRLLINATVLPGGNQISFTDDYFQSLNSRLDTYPLSLAVAASAAVPGIFHDIPLTSYTQDGNKNGFVHLADGGISENLGLETLLRMAAARAMPNGPPKACFIFLVDAFPGSDRISERRRESERRDLRKFTDFIFDENYLDAMDTLFARTRIDLLSQINLGRIDLRDLGYGGDMRRYYPVMTTRLRHDELCELWHITFPHLVPLLHAFKPDRRPGPEEYKALSDLSHAVASIKTHWHLTTEGSCDEVTLQNLLYESARILISEDMVTLKDARQWFQEHGMKAERSPQPAAETQNVISTMTGIELGKNTSGRLNGEVICKKPSTSK